ncbi:MAG: ATP-binding cassette domain-containing protein, partial [Leadbetterella sp.]|nr:ATP-binding cassette domain-containing protein [Leadbetterella sp.]
GRLTAADQEKIEEAIRYLNLGDIAGQYMDELSGGQKQRAFLAMVVAQDTDYILLDEPLNNLDMKHAVQIMKTLRQLCDEKGRTIVMVIHDINFAAQYSDFIVALKDSRVAFFDTVERVIVPEVLEKVFDMRFKILETEGKKICNYY